MKIEVSGRKECNQNVTHVIDQGSVKLLSQVDNILMNFAKKRSICTLKLSFKKKNVCRPKRQGSIEQLTLNKIQKGKEKKQYIFNLKYFRNNIYRHNLFI